MANKRMFSLSVVDTDKFLEMPISARLLYYELGMRADDDGFVGNWKKILLFTGLKEDDLKILIMKKFILPFESGVIVISHWRLNNYLQKDRTKPTVYQEEFRKLKLDNNNVYNMDTNCIHSIDKNRIEENSIEKNNNKENIYQYIENNFGRTISPLEYEKVEKWLSLFSEDIIKYAFEIAVLNGKRTFGYVEGIIKNWQGCNYTTLEEIKEKDKKDKKSEILSNEYTKEELTKEEEQELKNLFKDFMGDD